MPPCCDESAGIRGLEPVHSFVLLQVMWKRTALPIVPARGAADRRGMAAAFALGTEGVAMSTRFEASGKSPVHENYRAAIVATSPSGTLEASLQPGVNSRASKTEMARRVAAGEDTPERSKRLFADLYREGRTDITLGSAGESAGLIHAVKPVAQVIGDAVSGFWREIDRLSAMLERP